jgi:hypothetical protein
VVNAWAEVQAAIATGKLLAIAPTPTQDKKARRSMTMLFSFNELIVLLA